MKLENLEIKIEDGDRGKNYPSPDELSTSGYCLFLNNKNIIDNRLSLHDSFYITKEKHDILRAGSLSFNDIVLTTRGTLGNSLLVDKNFPLPARINSGMVILHSSNKIIPKYLLYFFESANFRQQVLSLQSGAAQPQLPIKDLLKMDIPILNMSEQQHIVNTISILLLKSL